MTTHLAGFWSYTHRDDDNDGGRICRLARLIEQQFSLVTGEDLELFVDRKNILWGQAWKSRIDSALIDTTFFIPIITPQYFKSNQCRKELLTFAGQARSLGVKELILPILYTAPPTYTQENPDDEAVALVKDLKPVDWRKLRLQNEESAEHRQAVAGLVDRLASIADTVAARPTLGAVEGSTGSGNDQQEADDKPGVLDILGAAEGTTPVWNETLLAIGREIKEVSNLTTAATAAMKESDSTGGGASGKLRVIQKYAKDLSPHARNIHDLGRKFASYTIDIDAGVLTLLRMTRDGTCSPEEKPEIEKFFKTILLLNQQVQPPIQALDQYSQSTQSFPGMSRDLRRPTELISTGIRQTVDGLSLITGWVAQINEIRESPKWKNS